MTINRSSPSPSNLLIQGSLSFLPALDLWIEALRRRRIRRSFGRLSDAQLRDIGLTPYELVVALSLPLKEDANLALACAATEEASKW